MGTSTNQRSPRNVPSWRIAQRVLGASQVPIERQTLEIWSAAVGDRGGKLSTDLCSASILDAAMVAARGMEPMNAVSQYDSVLDQRQESGVVYDMARHALVRAAARKEGAEGFARELFVEVANYYVSRDMPSIVAAPGRVPNMTAAIAIKEEVRDQTKTIVAPHITQISSEFRDSGSISLQSWTSMVAAALAALRRRRVP